jgi:RimJ/RimL family protein N-acetyltransferase
LDQTAEDKVPESGRGPRSGEQRSLSEQLWDLDWASLLPLHLGDDGLVARYSSFEELKPFIAGNYANIFEEDRQESPFSSARPHPAKARYMELTADFIAFELQGEPIGVLVGMPSDWSTYYIRSAAMVRGHQGRAAPQTFLAALYPFLAKHGVERAELDISPSNIAMMHIATRMRFNPTGTILSDRWGAMIRFSKFLDEDCETTFLRQFCAGVAYQERERRPRLPTSA